MQEILSVRNLSKRFGELKAVDGISFSVNRGECLGLLGPNGAGKTSAIRMIYGFSPLSGGELTLFGLDIRAHWREIKARIGVCQQDNTLDTDLSVVQNLVLFATYFDIPRAEARARADELLSFFALDHKRDAKVMELSGGMLRRLTLARALINEPDFLILDEPTTGLDPQSRRMLWDKLEALREQGMTLLLTTHYMEEASRFCDRIVIMDQGRILVEGAPGKLIRAHAGTRAVEIEAHGPDALAYVRDKGLRHDDLGRRLIVYLGEDDVIEHEVRERFCAGRCTFREASLEDVFLRLTGRALRE